MTISSVRTRDFAREDFTGDELAAMQKDADPSAVMNRVRHDVGVKGPDVGIRGDDKGNAELRKEWQDHDVEHAFGAKGLPADCAIEGLEGTIAHMFGIAKFAKDALGSLNDAEERGEALAANNERGAMHLAMLGALDLPQGYKNVEVAKWSEAGTANASGAMKMGTRLEAVDRRAAAVLQLHADRGMNAAEKLIDQGAIVRSSTEGDVAAIVARDPDLRARYDADPAFRAGFDALVWAKTHDEAAFSAAVGHLHARDARYDQHAIVRG